MELLINGAIAKMERLPYEDDMGHILQILIQTEAGAGEDKEDEMTISKQVEAAVRATHPHGGVMAHHEPDEEGFAEVRVLMGDEEETLYAMLNSDLFVTARAA